MYILKMRNLRKKVKSPAQDQAASELSCVGILNSFALCTNQISLMLPRGSLARPHQFDRYNGTAL